MKISSEVLPERQVRLEIEVEPERHHLAVEAAYRRLAPRVRIPGFRPGKAPRPLIERQLGRHRLLDEAMDILVPEVYREALDEQALDPVANPSLELVSHEPFVFKATVPLKPAIELGDYLSLRVPQEKVTVKDEQFAEALLSLRRRYGTVEPVDRKAKKGDIIRGNLKAEDGSRSLFNQDDIEYRLTDDSLSSLPGLADHVVGLAKGADVQVQVKAADDFEDERLAGKVVSYHIVVQDVKEQKLAPLDDSFAQEVGEGFATLKALEERVRSDLQTAEDDAALHLYHDAVVDALIARAKLDYPAVLVEREIDRILEEQASLDPRDQRAQGLYLQRMGKSEEEVRNEVREAAEQRLRRGLVLSQFAEAENIKVSEEDVDAELQSMAAQTGGQADSILRIFGTDNGRDTLRRTLLTRTVLARLVEIAGSGAAGKRRAKAATGAAAKTPSKRRRSAPRETE